MYIYFLTELYEFVDVASVYELYRLLLRNQWRETMTT
jgi:hypothetical protein